MNVNDEADIHVSFPCPFCGSHCDAGYLRSNNNPVVFHANPLCETYLLDEGPDEFLRRCRERYRLPEN